MGLSTLPSQTGKGTQFLHTPTTNSDSNFLVSSSAWPVPAAQSGDLKPVLSVHKTQVDTLINNRF